MIFAGIFLAKKFKVISGLFMSDEDRKLLEKTKRAFGMGRSSNPSPADTNFGQSSYSSGNNDMHPFGNSNSNDMMRPSENNDMQPFGGNSHEPSRRNPGSEYPTPKVHSNEPISVGGPDSAANLKDSLLGGEPQQP